ncbi:MAG: Hsp20/alpha crystallin family protein [Phycisphaerae bacterium]|jgi:HSP20 family protein
MRKVKDSKKTVEEVSKMTTLARRHTHQWPLWRWEDAFGDMMERFFEPTRFLTDGEWMPALDVAERQDSIVVRAEVPGLRSEDINVSVEGRTLMISGEKKDQTEDKGETYYRSERRYGGFRREVLLPTDVNAEKIEAVCHEGVLTITLPKAPHAKSRKILVKAA